MKKLLIVLLIIGVSYIYAGVNSNINIIVRCIGSELNDGKMILTFVKEPMFTINLNVPRDIWKEVYTCTNHGIALEKIIKANVEPAQIIREKVIWPE